ncbi:MAG: hypothetical protein K6G82_03280 [Ruminococcus sp.]|nr:hypothetical protein [Ruminococcus sp.]
MNRRVEKMGIFIAVIIAVASLLMWGEMLHDIISLHIAKRRNKKNLKALMYDEYTK